MDQYGAGRRNQEGYSPVSDKSGTGFPADKDDSYARLPAHRGNNGRVIEDHSVILMKLKTVYMFKRSLHFNGLSYWERDCCGLHPVVKVPAVGY